jgi:hypothetical protein
MSRASPIMVWITLPTTRPVRTDGGKNAMVLNRAMMSLVVASATDVAVPGAPSRNAEQQDAGRT